MKGCQYTKMRLVENSIHFIIGRVRIYSFHSKYLELIQLGLSIGRDMVQRWVRWIKSGTKKVLTETWTRPLN